MRGDGGYTFWFAILCIALVLSFLVALANSRKARQLAQDCRQKDDALSKLREDHAVQLTAKNTTLDTMSKRMDGYTNILAERKIQFPWLASAVADFHALEAERDAQWLKTKKHPAATAALTVREHGRKRREAEFSYRLMRYRVEYYEKIFPWIVDYVGDDVPDEAVDLSGPEAEPTDDPAKKWLNDHEYGSLSTAEKNQLALDRWRISRRSNWEIGRDYERFIGYQYELLEYDVTYTGAVEGFQDMGRDIIASKQGSILHVIQCKRWSQDRTIHEKHVFQLFGSALEYAFRIGTLDGIHQLSLFGGPIKVTNAKPVLYTTTKLSEVAKEVARKLDVEYYENVPISTYPLVKCNVSRRDGAKIYHLPFDQQYDRIKIETGRGEKYVNTIAEAEGAGFRRAWRWRPDHS
jgi:hypothetical protein